MAQKIQNDYEYYREISSKTSINCYTGGVQSLMSGKGYNVLEEDIWTLGKGFAFLEGKDEYGDPEICFDLFAIVNEFARNFNCKISKISIDFDNLKKQLKIHLDRGEHLIAWVNSSYMKYADLYYTSKGYLHAIVLEGIDEKNELVRVKDNLVVSMPTWSCKADLHFDELEKGLTDRVKTTRVDVMGYFYTINFNNKVVTITKEILKKALLEASMDVLKSFKNGKSAIIKYGEHCCKYIEDSSLDKKVWMLRRINDNIKTLYVLPNRILLAKVIDKLASEIIEYNNIKEKHQDLLFSWTVLANLCLKCSVSKKTNEIEVLQSYFKKVQLAEMNFWELLNKCLRESESN